MDKLVVFENTPVFREECGEMKRGLSRLQEKLSSAGKSMTVKGVRLGRYAYEYYLEDQRPLYSSGIKKSEAYELAKTYGSTGWFSPEEIEQFMQEQGTLFARAMYHLGYVYNGDGWRERRKDERRSFSQRKTHMSLQSTRGIFSLLSNEGGGLYDTYLFTSGYRKMLAFSTVAEEFGPPGTSRIQHLANHQSGFYCETDDVEIKGKEKVLLSIWRNNEEKTQGPLCKLLIPHQLFVKSYATLEEKIIEKVEYVTTA